jgi:anion-transporting  ArsA/GET3 family ATPase
VDRKAFRPPARVTIVAGKGGVGKTTVSAALAFLAAGSGLTTLVVEVQGQSGLSALFGRDEVLSYRETVLMVPGEAGSGSAELRARTLTPDDALVEYLEGHGLRRVSRRLTSTGTLDVVATAVPGIKDILVLGKVKQLEVASRAAAAPSSPSAPPSPSAPGGSAPSAPGGDAASAPGGSAPGGSAPSAPGGSAASPSRRAADPAGSPPGSPPDFIVVDAPAAGHAVSFLSSAYGLLDAASVGPIRAQAMDVVELLSDPERCQVMLVTVPEETPVNEAVDTAFHLEDRAGVKLAPIVVNGVWPALDLAADPAMRLRSAGVHLDAREVSAVVRSAEFRRHRQSLQAEQIARLAEMLPLPQLPLPYLFTTDLGRSEIEVLAKVLGDRLAAVE